MSIIDRRWATAYCILALECDSPIVEALHMYWSYVEHTLLAYELDSKEEENASQMTRFEYGDDSSEEDYVIDWSRYQDPSVLMLLVRKDGCLVQHAQVQTPELCLAAVTQNGLALQYVKDTTPELCLVAATQNQGALEQ